MFRVQTQMQSHIRSLALALIVVSSGALLSSCDPSPKESSGLPPSATLSDHSQAAVGTWYDAEGTPLPSGEPFVMGVWRGPEHCDWEDVLFLYLSWPLGTELRDPKAPQSHQFARWTGDKFNPSDFATTFDADAKLPAGAYDTGYQRKGWHLWVADKRIKHAVWLVRGDVVERWPASTYPIG